MSDPKPPHQVQPDPLLRRRIGFPWIILFAAVLAVLSIALFYTVSREPNGEQSAGISSDQAPRATSATTHQGVPQSGDRASSTGPSSELNAPPTRIAPATPVQNGNAAQSQP